jgi:hypothetical protein
MTGLLAKLAEFLGRLLAALLPAVGREIRKNHTVKPTGADDETLDMLDRDVWDTASSDRVQQPLHPEDQTPPRRPDSDH